MELGEEPHVKTAASIFRNVCYNNRDSLSAGILVAGWDKRLGGQVTFYMHFFLQTSIFCFAADHF